MNVGWSHRAPRKLSTIRIDDNRTMSLLLNHYCIVSISFMLIWITVCVPQSSKVAFSASAETCRSLSSQTIASNLRHPALCSGNHSCWVYVRLDRKFKKLEEHGSTWRICITANHVFGLFSSLNRFCCDPYNRSLSFGFLAVGRDFENVFSAVVYADVTFSLHLLSFMKEGILGSSKI